MKPGGDVAGLFGDSLSALGSALRALRWIVETILLGALAVGRMRTWRGRIAAVLAHEVACPNGHVVATYGRTQCRRCAGVREGWLFSPCPGCHARPAFIACPRCKSAIWNPTK